MPINWLQIFKETPIARRAKRVEGGKKGGVLNGILKNTCWLAGGRKAHFRAAAGGASARKGEKGDAFDLNRAPAFQRNRGTIRARSCQKRSSRKGEGKWEKRRISLSGPLRRLLLRDKKRTKEGIRRRLERRAVLQKKRALHLYTPKEMVFIEKPLIGGKKIKGCVSGPCSGREGE